MQAQLAPGHGTQASSGANLLTRSNRACGGGLVRKTGTHTSIGLEGSQEKKGPAHSAYTSAP